MLVNQLNHYLSESSIICSKEQQEQLLNFVSLLHKWNKAYNLTSVRSIEQMLVRHIMDSAVVSPYLEGNRFIDVGSGPGLPGIVLAILNPDKHFVLLDSLGKRIRFQTQVRFELGLKNIESCHSRVEDYQPEKKFDTVLSRAFASLQDMILWCEHLLDEKGRFLALKGKLHSDELQSIPEHFHVAQVHELFVPELDEQRHLVEVIKHDLYGDT